MIGAVLTQSHPLDAITKTCIKESQLRRLQACTIAFLGATLVTSWCGCSKIEDETRLENQTSTRSAEPKQVAPTEKAESQATTKIVRLADVLALWESGKKDDAAKQLE